MLVQFLLISTATAHAVTPFVTACPPLRIALIQDLSGSGVVNLTPRLTVTHVDQVVRFLARCGGEVAVGVIGADSRQPLLRFHVAPPPAAPAEVEALGTAFQRERGRKSHLAALERYQADSTAHVTDLAARSVAFRSSAERLLIAAASAQRSEVHGAIAQAARFLGEPTDSYQTPPRNVTVVVGDGGHNTGTRPGTLPVGTQLYLVNGRPTASALDHLDPVHYENLDALLRHLLKGDHR